MGIGSQNHFRSMAFIADIPPENLKYTRIPYTEHGIHNREGFEGYGEETCSPTAQTTQSDPRRDDSDACYPSQKGID